MIKGKNHIIFVSIPKYDWNKIAEDKEKNKEKKEV